MGGRTVGIRWIGVLRADARGAVRTNEVSFAWLVPADRQHGRPGHSHPLRRSAGAQARDGIGVSGTAALGVLGSIEVGSAIASANNGYYPGQTVHCAPPPAMSRRSATSNVAASTILYCVEHIRRVRVSE
ncbi:hypothetical protein [Methylobacterium sp. P5_C11]